MLEKRMIGLGVALSEIPPVTVAEDDAPGLLQGAIGVEQFASHRARAPPFEGGHEREEPSRTRQRVVVEEHEHVGGGGRRPALHDRTKPQLSA
jgi:hypothetical protein